MKKVLKVLAGIESVVCTAAFIIMLTFCFFQVLNRNIFKIPLGWTEELSRFSMVWMALLGSELGLRKGKQMRSTPSSASCPLSPRRSSNASAASSAAPLPAFPAITPCSSWRATSRTARSRPR